MALVGILSTMLLHEQFVARPVLAPREEPARTMLEESKLSGHVAP